MIKDHQRQLNRIHVVLDALVIGLSYLLAWYLVIGPDGGALPPAVYFGALWFIIPGFLILNGIFGLYAPKRSSGRMTELGNIFKASTIGLLLITLVLYLGAKNPVMYHFSRTMVGTFYVICIAAEALERNAIRQVLRHFRAKGYNQKHILLVGYSSAAESYIDRINANPEWGYRIMGILDDMKEPGYRYHHVSVIGGLDMLDEILEMNMLDELAITLSLDQYEWLETIVDKCERSGIHTKFIPDYIKILPTTPYIEDDDGLPVINIRRVPLTDLGNAAVKRAVDIVGGLFCLVLFSPVMLVTMIAIRLEGKGPIFFAQERVGRHNKPFKMYKFRSMEVQNEEDESKAWTTKHDPRVTRVGKFIRKTSIDEMPQFWNILKGDMSLVGPRPERPHFVEIFRDEIPHYMIKHQVRPGLTGWAQVNGLRGDTSIEKRIEYDLYYIENWTLWFDIRILFLTIFKGFVNKNAY